MSENIFADEWRDCLRAHFMHVIRTGDRVTEPSLTVVMRQAGFDDSELAELRVRATMHVDDVGADFVPDLDALKTEAFTESVAHVVVVPELPTETVIEQEVEAAVMADSSDDDQQRIDESAPEDEDAEQYLEEDDPDAPQQLSLF